MTRKQIRDRYGIVRLESPDIANKELSPEEAQTYEKFVKMSCLAFDVYWDNDDSGDVD